MSMGSKRRESRGEKKRKEAQRSRQTGLIILAVGIIGLVSVVGIVFLHGSNLSATTASSGNISTVFNPSNKPVILYVNQGNALVDRGNFSNLLYFAKTNHFNTIFFQVYRSGQLLFDTSDLQYFVEAAHLSNLSLFYSLYFTSPSELIPNSIYILGENGINLDMSTLPDSVQTSLLATLRTDFKNGTTAVTTTNLTTTLKPDLLVLETYAFQEDQSYIRAGVVGSIEALAVSSSQEYQQELQYALSNGAGVMVFDYYGLLKTGY